MKCFASYLLGFCLVLALQPAFLQAASSLADVDLDRIDESTLYFKAPEGVAVPKPLKTELYDLKYLGPLKMSAQEPDSLPYFLFVGRPCKGCLQDTGIYAIRPTSGRPTAYVHPGKIFEPRSRALLLEARGFFGRCLARQSDQLYVVFQKERVDRKSQLQSSVLVAVPGSDHMSERLIERHLPRLQDTLRLVKAKSCQEIEGHNRMMLTRPLDTGTRRNADEPRDAKDGDATKENQTDDDLESPDKTGG